MGKPQNRVEHYIALSVKMYEKIENLALHVATIVAPTNPRGAFEIIKSIQKEYLLEMEKDVNLPEKLKKVLGSKVKFKIPDYVLEEAEAERIAPPVIPERKTVRLDD